MATTARHSAAAGIIGGVVLSLSLALGPTAFAAAEHRDQVYGRRVTHGVGKVS
jgi:hypothetical protein